MTVARKMNENETNVVIAAPNIPMSGIRTTFNAKFNDADTTHNIPTIFVFLSNITTCENID